MSHEVYSITSSFWVTSFSFVIDTIIELLGLLADVCNVLARSYVPGLCLRFVCLFSFWGPSNLHFVLSCEMGPFGLLLFWFLTFCV